MRRLVTVARHPVGAAAKWLFDLHVTGGEHVPSGAYVIAANHHSFIDPVVVTLVAGHNVRYLAVAGLFGKSRAFDELLSFFGAIPTPRDRPPIAAVRTALRELEAGRPVGVFPEGRRVSYWREDTAQRGAAWLALATGVPLLPMAIQGTQGTLGLVETAFKRTSIRVWVDPPISPLDYTGHADPVGAMSHEWYETVGHHLDPWVLGDSRLEREHY